MNSCTISQQRPRDNENFIALSRYQIRFCHVHFKRIGLQFVGVRNFLCIWTNAIEQNVHGEYIYTAGVGRIRTINRSPNPKFVANNLVRTKTPVDTGGQFACNGNRIPF